MDWKVLAGILPAKAAPNFYYPRVDLDSGSDCFAGAASYSFYRFIQLIINFERV